MVATCLYLLYGLLTHEIVLQLLTIWANRLTPLTIMGRDCHAIVSKVLVYWMRLKRALYSHFSVYLAVGMDCRERYLPNSRQPCLFHT